MNVAADQMRRKMLADDNAYKINRWLPQNQTDGKWITFAIPFKREDDVVQVYVTHGVGMGAPYYGYADRCKMIYRISTGKLSFAGGGTLKAINRSEVEATIAGMVSEGDEKFNSSVEFSFQVYGVLEQYQF